MMMAAHLGPWDRTWHNHKTRGSLTVTIEHDGTVSVTTVLGQTRTVAPDDYSPASSPHPATRKSPRTTNHPRSDRPHRGGVNGHRQHAQMSSSVLAAARARGSG